ncbi:hypothetical protein GOQ30_11370 [Flavobacterium sp. TP390]|uniref:Uncharacterized protein n=1 Tax=Flavobacterium profundi TaxID=1774945 RepID=A0A6I4IJG0_9FLAO|nr:hypothetical protein [Flavobacterium profundi]MVO09758.1 hypothetical protein [Flavobacterium profundi]
MLKPNQFSPTKEEIENIIKKNKKLTQYEKKCYKCGHKPCSHCDGFTCDTYLHNVEMSGNWEDYNEEDIMEDGSLFPPHCCCDGQCSYD